MNEKLETGTDIDDGELQTCLFNPILFICQQTALLYHMYMSGPKPYSKAPQNTLANTPTARTQC